MPIRKHGAGWEVRLQHAGSRSSRTFGTFRDAQEYERRLKRRVEDHRVGRTPQYSLEEAVLRWIDGEAASLKSHRKLVNKVRVLYPHIDGRPLVEAPEAAEDYTRAALAAGNKPATVNRGLAILRRVARLAHRKWKWLEHDESGRITLLPGEEPRYVQASAQQVDALLAAASPRTAKAIMWAALTGLRQGELRAVTPHSFQGKAIVITKGKTTKPRVVPLARGLRQEDFPFGLTENEVARDFRAARKAAGMEWLQFRDLRRTCGSWIVQRTRSLKAAQDILGHTTIAITAKHYAHLLDDHVREAVAQLPRLRAGMARGRVRKKKAA